MTTTYATRCLWFSLGLLGLSWATAETENWPRFRGPTGQGLSTETGLPLEWNATQGVAWKTPIPGAGWSSPIVWGDLSEDGETVVLAAGAEFKILARNPLNERCQASLAVSGGRLLIRTDKHVVCLR